MCIENLYRIRRIVFFWGGVFCFCFVLFCFLIFCVMGIGYHLPPPVRQYELSLHLYHISCLKNKLQAYHVNFAILMPHMHVQQTQLE